MVKDVKKKYSNIHGHSTKKYVDPSNADEYIIWKCIGCQNVFVLQELEIGCTCMCGGRHFVCGPCFVKSENARGSLVAVNEWQARLNGLDIDQTVSHRLLPNPAMIRSEATILNEEMDDQSTEQESSVSEAIPQLKFTLDAGTGIQKRFEPKHDF